MLHKTIGIVLHSQKYSDTSLIVKIFTKHFGLQSYIINGVRNKKSKTKATLFQPLSLVDMEVSHSGKAGLQRLNELNSHIPFSSILTSITKSSIVLFLNEILYKSINEAHADDDLFEFIKNSLLILDLKTESCSNFHIYFMIHLSKFLGFFPHGKFIDHTSFFDLQEGCFINQMPKHVHYMDTEECKLLFLFINEGYETIQTIKLVKAQRTQLLKSLLVFYRLHITGFGEIKSLEILEEVIG